MEQIKETDKKTQPVQTKKEIVDDEPTLGKKPIWYLFLMANVVVIIACAITFALMYKTTALQNANLYMLPTVICAPIAIILVILFIWLESKDIAPKVMHFQKKWLKFYIIAGAFFIAAVLFSTIFFLICSKNDEFIPPKATKKWIWIIYLAVTGVFTLVSIGFQRYARFRIDLDVYRRKRGEDPNKPKEESKETKKEEGSKKKTTTKKSSSKKTTKKTKVTTASGGLLDQMDN